MKSLNVLKGRKNPKRKEVKNNMKPKIYMMTVVLAIMGLVLIGCGGGQALKTDLTGGGTGDTVTVRGTISGNAGRHIQGHIRRGVGEHPGQFRIRQ